MNKRTPYLDALYDEASRQSAFESLELGAGQLATPNPAVMNTVPKFRAQFDIKVGYCIVYEAALTHADFIPPVPVFGYNDFQGNFKQAIGGFDLPSNVVYRGSYVWPFVPNALISAATLNGLQIGDLIHWFEEDQAGQSIFYGVVLRCDQVAFGSLINATGSDRFITSLMRYALPDPTSLAQYSYQVAIYKQTLFGKISRDFFSPKSFILPSNQQPNVIDVPLTVGIDKQTTLFTNILIPGQASAGTPVDFTEAFTWSLFVELEKKASF